MARLIRLGDALSQFFNVLLLNGHPNESLSGRAWRTQSRWRFVIDAIFWFDPDHCRVAHENDVRYAKELAMVTVETPKESLDGYGDLPWSVVIGVVVIAAIVAKIYGVW